MTFSKHVVYWMLAIWTLVSAHRLIERKEAPHALHSREQLSSLYKYTDTSLTATGAGVLSKGAGLFVCTV